TSAPPGPAATSAPRFRSLFSWMQHVGSLPRARALSTGLVSILVLLDAARRRPFCRGVLTCILVSILVLLDAARRHENDVALAGADGFRSLFSWMQHVGVLDPRGARRHQPGFRSLFSWMQHVGEYGPTVHSLPRKVSILVLLDAARRLRPRHFSVWDHLCFDPCSPGCSTSATASRAPAMLDKSFDPCSPGCSTSASLISRTRSASACFDPCSPGCSTSATFQIFTNREQCRVSILVLLDAARRLQHVGYRRPLGRRTG